MIQEGGCRGTDSIEKVRTGGWIGVTHDKRGQTHMHEGGEGKSGGPGRVGHGQDVCPCHPYHGP